MRGEFSQGRQTHFGKKLSNISSNGMLQSVLLFLKYAEDLKFEIVFSFSVCEEYLNSFNINLNVFNLCNH